MKRSRKVILGLAAVVAVGHMAASPGGAHNACRRTFRHGVASWNVTALELPQ